MKTIPQEELANEYGECVYSNLDHRLIWPLVKDLISKEGHEAISYLHGHQEGKQKGLKEVVDWIQENCKYGIPGKGLATMELKDSTPAKVAGITLPFDSWQGFIEYRSKLP